MQRRALILLPAAWFAGCASLPRRDPLKVDPAGIESLPGEGLEVRMAVKLRLQNPNDAAVDYDGIALDLELRGHDFASGVSNARGSVPRFGEAVLTVPVTVSALALLRQALSLASGGVPQKVEFVARGKLAGPGLFGGVRFSARGEFELPGQRPAARP